MKLTHNIYLESTVNVLKILYTKASHKMLNANSVDPDQTASKKQSDQGIHCLPFLLVCFERMA